MRVSPCVGIFVNEKADLITNVPILSQYSIKKIYPQSQNKRSIAESIAKSTIYKQIKKYNKFSIKWKFSLNLKRKDEIIITRARIGHIRI